MSANPEIGRLRHRMTLEEPVATGDSGGGRTVTWSSRGEVWAAIEHAGAAEVRFAGRIDGRVTHRVTLRPRADVSGGMRLTMDGRVFRVLVAHDPTETGRWLELLVEEDGR